MDKHHSRTDFLERVRRYAIDTTRLTARRTQSYVGIFAGLRGPRKIIIVDSNNNHDFSDDTAFDFDTLTTERAYRGDTVELAPIVRVQYETINRKEVQAAHTYLRIKPYDAAYGYPQDIRRRLAVYSQPQVYRKGVFEWGGKSYKLNASTNRSGDVANYTTPEVTIQLADMDYAATGDWGVGIGKEMLVGDHLFTVLSSTSDGELTLIAERYDPNRIGGRVRNIAPVLVGKMDDNNELAISALLKKGSYVLLDFWGSWCGPCLAGIPALKALHQQVKADKLQLVGVDYEYNEEGRTKARKLEVDKQLSWPQVVEFSEKQTEASIPRRLGVMTYPTYILLSPEGRILMREVGETGLVAMKAKLAQLGLLTR